MTRADRTAPRTTPNVVRAKPRVSDPAPYTHRNARSARAVARDAARAESGRTN